MVETTCPRCGYCNEPSKHSPGQCGADHEPGQILAGGKIRLPGGRILDDLSLDRFKTDEWSQDGAEIARGTGQAGAGRGDRRLGRLKIAGSRPAPFLGHPRR